MWGSSLSHNSGGCYVMEIEIQLHYVLFIIYISSQTFEDEWNEAEAEIPSSTLLFRWCRDLILSRKMSCELVILPVSYLSSATFTHLTHFCQ